MTRKIAVIGLGAMGFAMAKRLVEHQHHVTGFDVRPEPIAALEAAGGHGAATALEAAARDCGELRFWAMPPEYEAGV